ncbi:hypothetical protein QVD17_08983 [Tagetes erecta]|uniref:HAT C-terminal dimerisation domain-containing protein n=1 Tax=Tagetes erecta TaxID=13708 RepID=A0AAD8P4T7_TARER|nr:hypothetical protein QVD17_08983 [Tagetes erecta]
MQGSTSNPRQQEVQNQVENTIGQDGVQLKAKRKRNSTIWEDVIELTLPDGTEKVKCIHCKTRLAVSTGKPTTTWKRHMDRCMKRKQYLRTQQMLNFQRLDADTTFDAFGEFLKDADVETPKKSKLSVYLEEGVLGRDQSVNFNVLDWWNTHKLKYRVLSSLASEILAVPISTVASEATFSVGGRVIDPYRSTLVPSTVEC